jgi:hypothetical protein
MGSEPIAAQVSSKTTLLLSLARSDVDIILPGHQHVHRTDSSARRYLIDGYAAMLIQAGTAVSSRLRQAANSFNIICINRPEISVECRGWRSPQGDSAPYLNSRRRSARTPAPGKASKRHSAASLPARRRCADRSGAFGPPATDHLSGAFASSRRFGLRSRHSTCF